MFANRPPRYRETPVTRTTRVIGYPLRQRTSLPCGQPARSSGARDASLLFTALVTRLAQQLPVLLLGHPLTALLDDGAHVSSQFGPVGTVGGLSLPVRSEEHTSELQSRRDFVCRLL